MRHVIATGTDGASVCFYDASTLPLNFDERTKHDPIRTVEELSSQGKFWWEATYGDGDFLFHFYIDEDVPESILPYSTERKETPEFHVPSGQLWVSGLEYAALDPLRGSDTTPGSLTEFDHMGGTFELPPGDYAVTTWNVDWPTKAIKSALEKKLGKRAIRAHKLLGVTTGVLLFAMLMASAFTIFTTIGALMSGRLTRRSIWLWAVIVIGWAVCILLMRKLSRMEKNPERKVVESEFPSIVVHMKRLTTT